MKFNELTMKDKLITIMFVNRGINPSDFDRLISFGVASSRSALSTKLSAFKKDGLMVNDNYNNWDLTSAGVSIAHNALTHLDAGEVVPVPNDVPEIEDTIQKTCTTNIIRNSKHITEESLKLAARMIDKFIASKSGMFELDECYEKIEELEKQLEEKNEEIKRLNGIIASLKSTNLNKLNMLDAANMKIMQLENSFDKISSSLSSMLPWISSLKDGSGM